MKRVRLDEELIAQGLAADASEALRLCMAGKVSAGGERLESPAVRVVPGVALHIKGRHGYVGRGGVKLSGALAAFDMDVTDLDCLDVGCSTGGFTDCLLKAGAARVVAVDVGRAQFDWGLRGDSRVVLLERTNVVDLPRLGWENCADLCVCDVSFTSIATVLPGMLAALRPDGRICTLVKPQFEAQASEVGEGGIVRDRAVHQRVLRWSIQLFADNGLFPVDICVSPITGAKGNREFFLLGDAQMGCCASSEAIGQQVELLAEKAGRL